MFQWYWVVTHGSRTSFLLVAAIKMMPFIDLNLQTTNKNHKFPVPRVQTLYLINVENKTIYKSKDLWTIDN